MSNDYIHGYTEAEMRRLTHMQGILNEAELAAIDLDGVRTVLDVGAGLGQMARAFARALGRQGRVVAVERDPRQREAAAHQAAADGEADLVELRAGDATALPLADDERGTFDLAHARFLLEHVPDPLAVVREMVRAVRPGGRVVLIDDDHEHLQLWPECPPMERLWRVYWESYRDHGFDPVVGRRMAGLLADAGAPPARVTCVFYGACRRMPLFDPVVDNLVGVIASSVEGLELERRMSRAEIEEAFAATARWRERDDATVWYALPMAEGIRPPHDSRAP